MYAYNWYHRSELNQIILPIVIVLSEYLIHLKFIVIYYIISRLTFCSYYVNDVTFISIIRTVKREELHFSSIVYLLCCEQGVVNPENDNIFLYSLESLEIAKLVA